MKVVLSEFTRGVFMSVLFGSVCTELASGWVSAFTASDLVAVFILIPFDQIQRMYAWIHYACRDQQGSKFFEVVGPTGLAKLLPEAGSVCRAKPHVLTRVPRPPRTWRVKEQGNRMQQCDRPRAKALRSSLSCCNTAVCRASHNPRS